MQSGGDTKSCMEFNSVPGINAATEGNKTVHIYTHTLIDVAYHGSHTNLWSVKWNKMKYSAGN